MSNPNIVEKITEVKQATLTHYRNSITRSRYVEDINRIREMVRKECLKKEPSQPDFVLIQELNKAYVPKQFGVLSAEESKLITEKLELRCRSVMSLRNLRNAVVMLVDLRENEESYNRVMEMDRMSAIVHVIDTVLYNNGAVI